MSGNLWEGMILCHEHDKANATNCDACEQERTEARARLEMMVQAIQTRLQGLAAQGVQMPPTLPLEIRVQVLLEMLLDDNPRQQSIFEGEVTTRIMDSIKNMQEQLKAPTLHLPKGVKF